MQKNIHAIKVIDEIEGNSSSQGSRWFKSDFLKGTAETDKEVE